MFAKLTQFSWGCPDKQTGPGPDFYSYSYTPNGKYTISHITDYISPPQTGQWNIEKGANNDWFLLYDNGLRLRMGFDGSNLILDSNELQQCKNTQSKNTNNSYSANTLPQITLSDKVKSISQKLTAQKWKKSNDLDLDTRLQGVDLKITGGMSHLGGMGNVKTMVLGH